MGFFYISWFFVCFACSMALEAINNGWLVNYGEKKVKLVKNICKGFMILSLVVAIIFTIITEIL